MTSSRLTKIIATIGPASSDPKVISGLIEAGVNVFRINCSHSDLTTRAALISSIKECSQRLQKNVGILLDLQGPKIRVGDLEDGEIQLNEGDKVIITTKEIVGNSKKIHIKKFSEVIDSLESSHKLLLDDGLIELRVLKRLNDSEIECEIIFGGKLKNSKGVNFPDSDLKKVNPLTEKDLVDLKHGIENNVALIALSFVRSAKDIELIKSYIPEDSLVKIIAKIEKPQALNNLDSILNVADGIMVARGDLGVEIPYEQLPAIQKQMIQKANDNNVLVITATQMLESMVSSPRPTRAEVTDVANSIFDGTDAIMLSAETASGKYPVLTVETMHKIALEAEAVSPRYRHDVKSVQENIARSACDLAERVKATAIAAFTLSGKTAICVSKQRPPVKVIALTQKEVVSHQLNLYWGITPIKLMEVTKTDDMMMVVEKELVENKLVKKGDIVIITGGMPISDRGETNFIKIHRCEGKYEPSAEYCKLINDKKELSSKS